jgi:hypothetical protein
MGLQAQQLEVTVHTRRRDGCFGGDRAHAPVRGAICRLCMQGLVNQLSQPLIVDRARLAGTYFVIKPVKDCIYTDPSHSEYVKRKGRDLGVRDASPVHYQWLTNNQINRMNPASTGSQFRISLTEVDVVHLLRSRAVSNTFFAIVAAGQAKYPHNPHDRSLGEERCQRSSCIGKVSTPRALLPSYVATVRTSARVHQLCGRDANPFIPCIGNADRSASCTCFAMKRAWAISPEPLMSSTITMRCRPRFTVVWCRPRVPHLPW